MDDERREIHFVGRVQGVGFRYTTNRIASGFAVTGWVKNLPNGEVKLVVEGSSTEIDAFLREIQATMSDNIVETRCSLGIAEGRFERFRIAH